MSIPNELRERPQWCWASLVINPATGKPDKAPRRPDGTLASVTDPTTWGTYADACEAVRAAGGTGAVGFILREADPYVVIDLDEPESDEDREATTELLRVFDYTYAETSISGQGYHIVGRGHWPSDARNRVDNVEAYDRLRFVIMTGDVYAGRDTISDFHPNQFARFIDAMGHKAPPPGEVAEGGERFPDDRVLDAARYNRKDGHIFAHLYDTPWAHVEGDKSAHDLALANLLARWTGSADQFLRLWERSARWRPEDKRNGNVAQYERYLRDTFAKARESMRDANQFIPYWMIDEGAAAWERAWQTEMNKARAEHAATEAAVADVTTVAESDPTRTIPKPPGLLGELAQFIMDRAPKPVWEIAIAGAIGILAGVAGRAYNHAGSGLNLYVVYIAPSGIGKDAVANAASVLPRLHERLNNLSHYIGKGSFTSAPAILRALEAQPSMYAIIDEVGNLIPQMVSQTAATGNTGGDLKTALLRLFNRSAQFSVEEGRSYAQASNNIGTIYAPAFSLVGSSNPTTFYKALSLELGQEGFISRLLVIDASHAKRPYTNSTHSTAMPSAALVEKMGDLLRQCEAARQPGFPASVTQVQATPGAAAMLQELDNSTTDDINAASADDPQRPILGRTHLKALRLAALVAVGVNPSNPVIDEAAARWAIDLVEFGDRVMLRKIATGEIGVGESADRAVLCKHLRQWKDLTPNKRSTYGATQQSENSKTLVPLKYLAKRMPAHTRDQLVKLMATAEVLGWVIETDVATKQLNGFRKQAVFTIQPALFEE